jgi:hypothetical protein
MIALLLALAAQGGIAAKYPGDEGIEKDPRVLFVEDFETGDLKEIETRWGNCGKPEHLELTDDNHAGSPGKKSLRVQFGHLYTHFPGQDQVFVRYYTKFDPKCGYTHHLPFLIADGAPTPWPKGWAGKKPAGDNFFGTALDAWGDWGTLAPPGKWMLYTYWQEMKPDGRGDYWGNMFKPPGQLALSEGREARVEGEPIERGRWYCVEMMIKANSTPEAADGEEAFWVDGKKVGEFKGFRWRSNEKLKINSFWLEHDGETGSTLNKDADHANRVYNVWFDDVVIATEYIGPVLGTPKNGKKAAAAGRTSHHREKPAVPPGKAIFTENFESGAGKFTGGEAREGALVVPPKGVSIWGAFSTPVQESTAVRFKLKPLADVGQVTVMIWSDKIKDNGRYFITGLKKGEWKTVEIRGVDVRGGWAMDGPSLDGSVMKSFTLLFDGAEDARLLLGGFEVHE